MIRRIVLFLATNIAVILIFSIILNIFNVQPYLKNHGLDYQSLLVFAALIGFSGSLISMFISKWMAVHAFNIKIIQKPSNPAEKFILSEAHRLAKLNHIGIPEVGIYDSPEPNAFATGWNRNNALVAVSTGLLSVMDESEVKGVLGHEVAHIANGDMVTLTLIQGVVNTFVIFFARIAAFFVSRFLGRDNENMHEGFMYYGVALIFELIFGILATAIVMWFSRYREFRADFGSAETVGRENMVKALKKLKKVINKSPADDRAPAFNTMKIAGHHRIIRLFSSHPPIEERIKALSRIH